MIEQLLRKLIAREAVPLADALEAQLELTLIRQELALLQERYDELCVLVLERAAKREELNAAMRKEQA